MKRSAGTMVLLAAMSGCVTTGTDHAPWAQPACSNGMCGGGAPPAVPGTQGPWGQPVTMAFPYSANPGQVDGAAAARAMLSQSVPLDMVQQAGYTPGMESGLMQASHGQHISPPGVPGMPGGIPPGAVAAAGMQPGAPQQAARTEVLFSCPVGMKVSWYVPNDGTGKPGFPKNYALDTPGRYNFLQGATYRLKVSEFSSRPEFAGRDLYPTLQVYPSSKKTEAFVAHSAVPVAFTDTDFEQVRSGNFVVKVIYLPDPQFQETATTGIGCEEIVSSPLEPGVDPVAEASRRGTVLLVVRMGNIDLEAKNTPAMDAPAANMPHPGMPGPGMPGMPGMPPGMMPGGPGRPGMPGPGGGPMVPGRPPMPGGSAAVPQNPLTPIMTPQGAVLMSPNGPMLLTPEGPVPYKGTLPQPNEVPQPSAGTPVGSLPTTSTIQTTQYQDASKVVPSKKDTTSQTSDQPKRSGFFSLGSK